MSSKKGGDQGVNEMIEQIYKEIRNRHNTISLFLKNYAINHNGVLKNGELVKFLNECNLNPTTVVLKGILAKFGSENSDEILFEKFRSVLEKHANTDLKGILLDIV